MNKELLDQAINNLDIQDVYLGSGTITTKEGFFPQAQKKPLTIQFMNEITGSSLSDVSGVAEYKSLLIYHYEVGFRAIPSDLAENIKQDEKLLKKEILVEVKAMFNASYLTKDDISEEAMQEFGYENVAYHIWPYWREYATSIATRMRLPNFIVPMKRAKDIR